MKKVAIAVLGFLMLCSIGHGAGTIVNPSSSGGVSVTSIGAVFDSGGAALVSGKVVHRYMDYAGTITQWTILCDQNAGTSGVKIDVWKSPYSADTLPTISSSITSTATPTVASGHKTAQGTLASWSSNTVGAGDVISVSTLTTSSATWCILDLRVTPQ